MGPHSAGIPADVLHIEFVDFRTLDNAKDHRTFNYEIVQEHDRPTPVYRRGQPFFMNIVSNNNDIKFFDYTNFQNSI